MARPFFVYANDCAMLASSESLNETEPFNIERVSNCALTRVLMRRSHLQCLFVLLQNFWIAASLTLGLDDIHIHRCGSYGTSRLEILQNAVRYEQNELSD